MYTNFFDQSIVAWQEQRTAFNDLVLKDAPLALKRFFSLDHQTYEAGALDAKTKELLGLACSLVLRCDDCVLYHVIQCKHAGTTKTEFLEAANIALLVGGSIVIPHLRRAVARWEELETTQ